MQKMQRQIQRSVLFNPPLMANLRTPSHPLDSEKSKRSVSTQLQLLGFNIRSDNAAFLFDAYGGNFQRLHRDIVYRKLRAATYSESDPAVLSEFMDKDVNSTGRLSVADFLETVVKFIPLSAGEAERLGEASAWESS